ncbi:unnamed protein product [Arctia plantaginis]|uniref:Uncharacterized protein n=1 Tax=Arctia plantaginis TaxID=874455 RepID=A0A8S1AND2_ARCPL|nr:unnamed protein product [Arctia plantaginis]
MKNDSTHQNRRCAVIAAVLQAPPRRSQQRQQQSASATPAIAKRLKRLMQLVATLLPTPHLALTMHHLRRMRELCLTLTTQQCNLKKN